MYTYILNNYLIHNYLMIPLLYNVGGFIVKKVLVYTLPTPMSNILCLTM